MAPCHALTFKLLAAGMWQHGTNGDGSAATLDRRFKSFFGCSPTICSILWDHIDQDVGLAHARVQPFHLMWALMFLKVYDNEHVNAAFARCNELTFRSWTRAVIICLSDMDVVRKMLSTKVRFSFYEGKLLMLLLESTSSD